MNPTQKLFAVLTSTAMLAAIIFLVRSRKLREEYAWLWVLTASAMVVLTAFYPMLELLTRLIGAVTPTTTLFLFGLLFMVLIGIHFSIVISRLSQQVRRVTQELALMTASLPPKSVGLTGEPDQPAQEG